MIGLFKVINNKYSKQTNQDQYKQPKKVWRSEEMRINKPDKKKDRKDRRNQLFGNSG